MGQPYERPDRQTEQPIELFSPDQNIFEISYYLQDANCILLNTAVFIKAIEGGCSKNPCWAYLKDLHKGEQRPFTERQN